MKRWLLTTLFFLLVCLPTAYGAEEVVIKHTTAQEVQAFLLDEAKERDMFIREKGDTFLDMHMEIDSDYFASLWGKDAYLRCFYRFYPHEDGIRVTYETQVVCGAHTSPLTAKRLGDYHEDRRSFAETRIITTIESLSKLRLKFDGYYLYGLILGKKDGDTLTISEVLPVSPCEQAGITTEDTILRFAGRSVKEANEHELLYTYMKHCLTAKPLPLTIRRDDKIINMVIAPQHYTAHELANWSRIVYSDNEQGPYKEEPR